MWAGAKQVTITSDGSVTKTGFQAVFLPVPPCGSYSLNSAGTMRVVGSRCVQMGGLSTVEHPGCTVVNVHVLITCGP